jgi:3',5'-cyclic-AMP phosphodiesterase
VSEPFLLVQLSDSHVGANWNGVDPVRRLRAAVKSVSRLDPGPGAVLISGDLVENAADAEYEQLRRLVEPLDLPLYVLPGNHDDRDALRRHFDVPGGAGEPVQYTVDLGPLRLVAIDSTIPGEEPGELDSERLAWLDEELAAAPARPTLLALHHPPLWTGVPAIDEIGLRVEDRHALGDVVGRHPHVRRIVAGHVHRTVAADLAGRPVLAVPSTYVQLKLDFRNEMLALTAEPPGFAVHALRDGELVSHVQPVT